MNDDQILLASAYVDDDLDDAARAQAEADPDVMAEIVRLRSLRAELRAVDGPDPGRREAALAAALVAFADEALPTTAPITPVPLPRRARRSWWGGALAAAAAVVVVVGAAVALRSTGGSDGDDAATSATVASGDTFAQQESSSDQIDRAAPAEAGSERPGAADAPAAAVAPTDAAGTTSSQVTPVALSSPEELATFAQQAADRESPPSPAATCVIDGTFVGQATYVGTPVEVFVDGTVVTALDAATCAVVERVGP